MPDEKKPERPVIEHTLVRLAETTCTTKGEWRDAQNHVLCAVLERGAVMDECEGEKGQPRPVAGRYKLRLKEEGSKFEARYRQRFPWFKHMVEIDGVPDRDEILAHTGNKYTDSRGCLLTGTDVVEAEQGWQIPGGSSMPAFAVLYQKLYADLAKADVYLTIQDIGQP